MRRIRALPDWPPPAPAFTFAAISCQLAAMPRLSAIPATILWLAILGVTAGLLYYNGRSPICPCGTVQLIQWTRVPGQDSQQILDVYSFTHVLHGLLFYFLIWLVGRGRVPFLAGLLLATLLEGGWELFENSAYIIDKYQSGIATDYKGDSIINSLGDIVTMSFGFFLASLIPAWLSVVIFIATEAILAYTIRDNLTLNIIGLTHPIQWISEWQDAGQPERKQ
jgi:Protein of unknown function (DUF2585)